MLGIFNNAGKDQFQNAIDLLSKKQSTRRAVIQIYQASDIHMTTEVPCTCTLQLLVRKSRLHMITNMRSNDAYLGMPHDIFSFTMLQEIAARSLGLEVGEYKHFVGSLHLYEEQIQDASLYVEDGYQERTSMPPMPLGDPESSMREFLRYEKLIRQRKSPNLDKIALDPYWTDLLRLLRVFRFYKDKDSTGMLRQMNKIRAEIYSHYVELKRSRIDRRSTSQPSQQVLFPSTKDD